MPKKSIYDPYTDWILEHYKDYRNCPELVKVLKDNFGLDKANESSIKFWFSKRFGMTTVYGRYDFSEKEKEFIKKYYPDHGPEKTAEMLNEVFETNRTVNSVKNMANSKLGLSVSDSFINELNKIKHEKMMKAHVKESRSIRKETRKNGRICYKMKADNGQWRTPGIVIWEESNSPIPKGYRLIYLDGDNLNYQLDNLWLVTDKISYQVQTNKHYQIKNPEITKSLIKYYELRNALGVDWVQWHNIEQKFERKFNRLAKEE